MERYIRFIAGALVLIGTSLSLFFSSYWLALPIFVSLNLISSGITGFCLMEVLLKRLGIGQNEDTKS